MEVKPLAETVSPGTMGSLMERLAGFHFLERRFLRSFIDPLELSCAQFDVLVTIADRPACTVRKLSQWRRISPQAIHRSVSVLQHRGLVRGSKGARRPCYLHVTPAGHAVNRRIRLQRSQYLADLLDVIQARDLRQMGVLLNSFEQQMGARLCRLP